jgi:hypothetical protein
MNGKKMHMKVIVNVQTKMNMKKGIDGNTRMAMNMNENMNEREFAREFRDECEDERKDDDEVECNAGNGNEMLLNCLLPRRPSRSHGEIGRYPTSVSKISWQKCKTCLFGNDSSRCSRAE